VTQRPAFHLTTSRREFLALGALLPWASPFSRVKDNPGNQPGSRKLFLFVDWYHVKKGEQNPVLDPARVSAQGKELREKFAREFNRVFDYGEHGFRPVDIPWGVRIAVEPALTSEPWLIPDRPWEDVIYWTAVIPEEGRYRCWYDFKLKGKNLDLTFHEGRAMEIGASATGYMESTDGWSWTKPALELYRWAGSLKTNIVTHYANSGTVFRDNHGRAEERYKKFHFDVLPEEEISPDATSHQRYALYGVTSPDGYKWTKHSKPLIRYFSDTQNIAAWDPLLGKYVGYFRHHLAGRAISRAETTDFWDWPAPYPIIYAGPMDSPADDLYTNGYSPYPDDPSLRLLFASIYHHDSDGADVRLAVSRDGRAYQWVAYEPVIRTGGAGQWNSGQIYPGASLLHLPGGSLAVPLRGHNTSHNEAYFRTFYGDYKIGSGVGWAIWKDARLAGIEAPHLGAFTMQPARFDGTRIQINARTARSGSVELELRERGQALEGFRFADCIPFRGDEVWADCRWKGQPDLAKLRGKTLELAFRLNSAKLFACRF